MEKGKLFKLLLVDDEEIEREGMAEMIPWEKSDMELVGTAWNGIEGLEKLQMLEPDVVVTDIKMPVMNGIELIRKGQALLPDTVFVVLSGYGEYAYTSQAMELGVRHYILKPCDEEKMLGVLEKVRAELLERSLQREQEWKSRRQIRQLLPRAKAQIFSNLLLRHEQISDDYSLFLEGLGDNPEVGLLVFRAAHHLDYMEDFVLTNILEELFGGEQVLLHTLLDWDAVYLLRAESLSEVEPLVRKIEAEFQKYEPLTLQAAVSRFGVLADAPVLYQEISSLLAMRIQGEKPLLLSTERCGALGQEQSFMDFAALQAAERCDQFLFELCVGFARMQLAGLRDEALAAAMERTAVLLMKEGKESRAEQNRNGAADRFGASLHWQQRLFLQTAVPMLELRFGAVEGNREEQRMRDLFLALYGGISEQGMSMQYLAREVLYMNEDHLGRLFQRYTGERYSAYLQAARIRLAQRLLADRPEIRVGELAERVGYPPDGQYFAKAFKKQCGVSPSEYRAAR